MKRKIPMSAAEECAAAAQSSATLRAGSSISKWLDIIKKIIPLVKQIIPLIKSCFKMSGSSSSSTESTKDILSQLANILPTGTFMTFQVIAPLATNNGHCGTTEKIVSGVLLGVFAIIIAISSFTDSVKIASTGEVFYGLVTSKGLWNPKFRGSGIPGVTGAYYTSGGSKYTLRPFDFVSAALSLAAFAALSLLTDPVTSCYFKNLSSTVVKAVPLVVGVVISFLLTFAPTARNGVGFRVDASKSVDHASPTHSSILLDEPMRP